MNAEFLIGDERSPISDQKLWEAILKYQSIPVVDRAGKYIGTISEIVPQNQIWRGTLTIVDAETKQYLQEIKQHQLHLIVGLNCHVLFSGKGEEEDIQILNAAIVGWK